MVVEHIFNYINIIGVFLIVQLYCRVLWKTPQRNGEIFGYWVSSWFYLLVLQFLYLMIEYRWISNFPSSFIINSLLIILLSYYVIVTLIIRYERDLAINSLKAWRIYRFSSIVIETLVVIVSLLGFLFIANPVYYSTTFKIYSTTGFKNADLFYQSIALVFASSIPIILWPVKIHGHYDRVRLFLFLGGISYTAGKILQLIQIILELSCIYSIFLMRTLFTLSIFLVFLGIHNKKDIEYVSVKSKKKI